MDDPFLRLGIPPTSSIDAIKKAYRHLCLSCHPDMRDDKEAATIEFRELTSIYQIALSRVTTQPPPKPQPPPPPKPDSDIIETCTILVENFEIALFGEIIRDIRVSRELLAYGGKVVIILRLRGKPTQSFVFVVPPQTRNAQKFRFNHFIGIIEIMVVTQR